MEPDAVEIRVLGCLLEKQRTTPDVYPLSLNSLRLACNQATSREPVVDYDEATIREALNHLGNRRWTRLASASRTVKYRHLLDEALGLQRDALALLCVMMLRGPQTLNELRARTKRLHDFDDEAALLDAIHGLIARDLVELLPRQPGQKEQRYRQMIGGGDDTATPRESSASVHASSPPVDDEPDDRIAALEAEVVALRNELSDVRAELSDLRTELGA